MDGINDDNRGDKVGKVAFSGGVKTRSGMMYLFETEGRNIAVIDSAKMTTANSTSARSRWAGLLWPRLRARQEDGEIVFNPDKPVRDDFQNGRLVGGRTESRENRAGLHIAEQRRPTRTRSASSTSSAGAMKPPSTPRSRPRRRARPDPAQVHPGKPRHLHGQVPHMEAAALHRRQGHLPQ